MWVRITPCPRSMRCAWKEGGEGDDSHLEGVENERPQRTDLEPFSFPRTEGERQNLVILGDACGKLLVQQGGPRIDFF